MTSRARWWHRAVSLALVLGTTSATSIAQTQSFRGRPTRGEEISSSGFGNPAGLTTEDVVAKMLERNRERSEGLHRYSAVRTYEIKNSEGKLAARAVVHVTYEAPDRKTFDKISEQGSRIVRHLVFDRLIETEGETSSGRVHHDSAISTANYAFALTAEEDLGPYHCFILEATPKRNDKYLFEGRIWVDAQDFAVVKIAGHPAKKPSFWVNRADFVRQYQKVDGFWLPYRDETSVEVKIYGRKVFTVDHRQYTINSADPAQAEVRGTGVPH